MKKHFLVFALILFLIFIFRLPSLFEPFWYGDEGIFAAVANNLNQGGVLYRDSWDNKPPMIYLTYAAIFKFFGVSMFWLRLAAAIVVLTTAAVIYEIGQKMLSKKRALLATFTFGFLTSLRLIEGNLALTEILMILPITLAILMAILRKFDYVSLFFAGFLFAVASLYKQVGALETGALGIYIFLISKNFGQFFTKGLVLTAGFAVPFLAFIAYFAPKNLVGEYIFAAYTYYRIYFGESPKYTFLINLLKFLPIMAAVAWGAYQKARKKVQLLNLLLLWAAFSALGSFFSGRTYGHYLIQTIPAISLILASINLKFKFKKNVLIFGLFFLAPLLILTKVLFFDFLTSGPLNQFGYWGNFLAYSLGKKGLDNYNDYFDKNVNSIMALADFFATRGDVQPTAYIWGDYPWLYAISDLKNPVRYVTSFHVFGVGGGRSEVAKALTLRPPKYIIKPASSIGYFNELERLLVVKYRLFAKIESADVYIKEPE
ncbi:glycosyltransferase family 39 protein [Candidatus Curtissbacteria bacterium]|nr:glycosyltransferase family 39 protein [Candidatus Curtissbacteria bacterium]